jgi:hypothetical protein
MRHTQRANSSGSLEVSPWKLSNYPDETPPGRKAQLLPKRCRFLGALPRAKQAAPAPPEPKSGGVSVTIPLVSAPRRMGNKPHDLVGGLALPLPLVRDLAQQVVLGPGGKSLPQPPPDAPSARATASRASRTGCLAEVAQLEASWAPARRFSSLSMIPVPAQRTGQCRRAGEPILRCRQQGEGVTLPQPGEAEAAKPGASLASLIGNGR